MAATLQKPEYSVYIVSGSTKYNVTKAVLSLDRAEPKGQIAQRVTLQLANVKVGDTLEISYNRIFAPGEVLSVLEEDEETGEGVRVNLQLNGEILNQAVEIDFNEIYDDLLEMNHITEDKEVIIEIDF